MLIRFVVSNFLSFEEETEFNMIAGNFKNHKHHVYNLPKLSVLKSAAIYGANGAGKSNLINAISYFQEIVSDGEIRSSVNSRKFKLNKMSSSKPMTFEVEFFSNKKTYAYGLSLNGHTVEEEWLYETGITKEDKLIFERKTEKSGKNSINISAKYLKSQRDKLLIELLEDNLLKNNELLIGKYEVLRVKEFDVLRDWFHYGLLVIFPGSKFTGLVSSISNSAQFKSFANELLSTFDTGLRSLDIQTIPLDRFLGEDEGKHRELIMDQLGIDDEVVIESRVGPVMVVMEKDRPVVKKVVSLHQDNLGDSVVFDLIEESDGTQRMLDFLPAFNRILNNDMTIIIDEIDQSLHPVFLKSLIEKTMADTDTKGQLIFSTHESNLLDLDIFRQDEIWFVEKENNLGSSKIYSLSEFKPRYDLDIKKGYLKGRFGAIPFMADLKALKWQESYA